MVVSSMLYHTILQIPFPFGQSACSPRQDFILGTLSFAVCDSTDGPPKLKLNTPFVTPPRPTMSGPSIDNDAFFQDLPPLPEGWDWKRCASVQPAEWRAVPEAHQSLIRAHRHARLAQWRAICGADDRCCVSPPSAGTAVRGTPSVGSGYNRSSSGAGGAGGRRRA